MFENRTRVQGSAAPQYLCHQVGQSLCLGQEPWVGRERAAPMGVEGCGDVRASRGGRTLHCEQSSPESRSYGSPPRKLNPFTTFPRSQGQSALGRTDTVLVPTSDCFSQIKYHSPSCVYSLSHVFTHDPRELNVIQSSTTPSSASLRHQSIFDL